MSNVSTLHPDYQMRSEQWQRMRDCIEGQDRIKARGVRYLPKSAGQRKMEELAGCEEHGPYHHYKRMARFPEIVDATVQGFLGLATRKQWKIEGLPASMNYLENNAGWGFSLEEWQGNLITEGLTVGRYALYPDAPVNGGKPQLSWYDAESITNWKLDAGMPWLVVLKESTDRDPDDLFGHDSEDAWRVVRLVDGQCIVEQYDSNEQIIMDDQGNTHIILEHARGEIPIIIGGSANNDWYPDKPPLVGIADCALAYYQLSAQQRWAIKATCDPMFLAKGFEPGEITIMGGGAVLEKNVEPSKASLEPIEVSGTGIDKATGQMESELSLAKEQSFQFADKSSVESGDALGQRASNKTATLKSIDRNAASAFEKALNMLCRIDGRAETITVESTFDYSDKDIDAVVLTSLSNAVDRGQLPEEVVSDYVQDRGMLEGYDQKAIRAAIDEDDERRQERTVGIFGVPVPDDEVDAA